MTPGALPNRRVEGWRWSDLMDSLSETLDEARLRGIEPEAVCRELGHFLPAALMVVTKHQITVATDLRDNNPG